MDGGALGGRASQHKAARIKSGDLEVYKAQQRGPDWVGAQGEERMVEMRLEKKGPGHGGPGGPQEEAHAKPWEGVGQGR